MSQLKKIVVKDETQIAVDKQLALTMQTGTRAESQVAFQKLYKRYQSPLFYYSLQFLKMNSDDAEDAVQEIFSRIFDKIKQYNPETSVLSTWMYRIAHNHLVDMKRKENYEVLSLEKLKSEFNGDDSMSEIHFQLEDYSSDTMSAVIKQERAKLVLDAIASIKKESAREVITLIFLKDMSYEKVAAQLNLPIGTVKAFMCRAKGEMKTYLTKKSTDFEYGRISKKSFKTATTDEEELVEA